MLHKDHQIFLPPAVLCVPVHGMASPSSFVSVHQRGAIAAPAAYGLGSFDIIRSATTFQTTVIL